MCKDFTNAVGIEDQPYGPCRLPDHISQVKTLNYLLLAPLNHFPEPECILLGITTIKSLFRELYVYLLDDMYHLIKMEINLL
jgi:hypothetical protein